MNDLTCMRNGAARRELLESIQRAFNAESVAPLLAGGSQAELMRLTCSDGRSLVAKFQTSGEVLVDGHELVALKRKVLQIRMVRERLPRFSPYCAEVLCEFEQRGAYGFVMPYYAGETITQRLLAGRADRPIELRQLLNVLIEHGYSQENVAAPSGQFEQLHISRVKRRLPLVFKYLPRAVADARLLEVNGVRTEHVGPLIERLLQRPELLARLEPRSLSLALHGDAVLSNFIWNAQGPVEFTAIDPRGTLEPWDPAYDFAKMLFSLSIYDLAMEAGFAIEMGEPERDVLPIELRLRREAPVYQWAALGFFETIESVPAFSRLPLASEASWRERVLFACAMHCLAFAACRLVDSRDPVTESAQAVSNAKRDGVLGFYLAGVAYLGALLDADSGRGTLDIADYLRVLFRNQSASAAAPANPGFNPAATPSGAARATVWR